MNHSTDASVMQMAERWGTAPKGPTAGKEKPGMITVTWNYRRHIEVTNCINETVTDC